nr:hypothetical protein [uncultured Faecalimonas sp.]
MKQARRRTGSFRRYIRRYLRAVCRKRRYRKRYQSVRYRRRQALFRMSFILIIVSILFTNEKSQHITSEKSKSVQTSENDLLEKNPLEKNKYQPLNYLVVDYYTKLSSGDLNGIRELYDTFSEESFEKIKAGQNLAEWYQGIDIYTKKAEEPDAYIAFVSYHMKLCGADLLLPGLETMYVKEEDGAFYLVDKPYAPEVEREIRELAEEKEVKELLSQVENQYAYASRDKKKLEKALKWQETCGE